MSQNTKSKSILIVGETGGGKSTFINTITNYFKNGSLDDLKVAIPTKYLPSTEGYQHTENNTKNIAMSQTDSCTTYVFEKNGIKYSFIDTPGLNDTRCSQQDEANMKKILDNAKVTSDLTAVLLIVNGTQSRLTPAMENILVTLRGAVPDSAMRNLIVVLSKCDKERTAFQRSVLATIAPNIQKESIFYMDNTAFVSKPVNGRIVHTSQLESEWKKSMKTCKKLTQLVNNLDYVPVWEFEEVVKHRDRIRGLLHDVKLEMKKYQDVLEQLVTVQARDRELANDEAKFKSFTQNGSTSFKTKQATSYNNLICSQCNHVCQENCNMSEVTQSGTEHFVAHAAMDASGNCTKCPSKCNHKEHYHAKYIFVDEQQSVATVLEDMKQQYDDFVKERESVTLQINTYNDTIKSLNETMQTIVDVLNRNCNKLKQLCTGFNFADELRVMYNQLKLEAKKQRTIEAQNAMAASLEVMQKMIDFHSAQSGSNRDAQLMRPDLDEYDDTSDEDTPSSEDEAPVQAKRIQRQKKRKNNKKRQAAQNPPSTPSQSQVTQSKFPEKTRVAVPEPESSEDDWDDVETSLGLTKIKTTANNAQVRKPKAKAKAPVMLLVGDIDEGVTEKRIEEVFAAIGPVSSVRLCRDRTANNFLGCAYVQYKNRDDGDRAIKHLNSAEIDGKPCRVAWSQRGSSESFGSVLVKNLPESIDDAGLYEEFSRFGNIGSCSVNNDGSYSGVVHFETEEIANKAIEAAKDCDIFIDGAFCTVDRYDGASMQPSNDDTYTNIYVKNLPLSWTQKHFEKFFSKYGVITSSFLKFDTQKNENVGYGFIAFETHDQAVAALVDAPNCTVKENGVSKKLSVTRARDKSEREQFKRELAQQNPPKAAQKPQQNPPKSAQKPQHKLPQPPQKTPQKPQEKPQQRKPVCNLYVKFLPDSATEPRLTTLFGKCGTVTSVKLMTDADGVQNGTAFVCFKTPEDAANAIDKLDGFEILGKRISVSYHRPKASADRRY